MSRSLAIVGILTIIGIAGSWTAVGQDATSQTAAGSAAKNHISDAERDRLMRKAMEDARLELEEQKAAKLAQEEQKDEIKKRADEAAVLAAETRRKTELNESEQAAVKAAEAKKAAADKKAEMAKSVIKSADSEKKAAAEATAKVQAEAKSDVKNLDKVEAKTPEKNTPKSAKNEKTVASSKESKSKSNEGNSFYSEDSDSTAVPEKTIIETVSTKELGSGISVKTSMPIGDEERKAEQAAARTNGGQMQPERSGASGNGERQSMSGQVVGMMRSSDGKPRILLNTDDSRMIQVILEDEDEDVPAPGSFVSIKGREIGGANGRPVIRAQSVSITRGEAIKQQATSPRQSEIDFAPVQETVMSRHVTEGQFGMPMGPVGMPPPFGLMPPPMPMMQGGPMFGPHPPF